MRKVIPLSFLLCLLLLAGCKAVSAGVNFNPGGEFSKAQKIVVLDAAGTEKAVLESEEEIDGFVQAMNVEGWSLATELPEDLEKAGSFTLWQTETVTALLGEKEAEVKEICTFIVYQDGDYLTIDTGFASITISFSVPEETSAYLRNLLQ